MLSFDISLKFDLIISDFIKCTFSNFRSGAIWRIARTYKERAERNFSLNEYYYPMEVLENVVDSDGK